MLMVGSELCYVNVLSLCVNVLFKLCGNFFLLNLDEVCVVFELVLWVWCVSVCCVWFNGLLVEVQEYEVFGIWGGNEFGKLVNMYGEVFVVNLVEVEDDIDLVVLVGFEGIEQDVVDKLEIMIEWFKLMNVELLSVMFIDCYVWCVWLFNGMVIELG